MKSKPDTVMAQMGNPSQVKTAIDHLHGTQLFGVTMALRYVFAVPLEHKPNHLKFRHIGQGVLSLGFGV